MNVGDVVWMQFVSTFTDDPEFSMVVLQESEEPERIITVVSYYGNKIPWTIHPSEIVVNMTELLNGMVEL